jgi:enoyl-CoA hydratase
VTTVLTERRSDHLLITLNRPQKLNALNHQVLSELEAAILSCQDDPAIRSVILTGSGDRAFCAGADIDELHGLSTAAAADLLRRGNRIIGLLSRIGVPVISAVNGYALGGGFEIALASTFILASTKGSFGLPETSLGLIPGYGGTQRLSRLVGRQAAAYLITTGRRWDAAEAHARGLLAEAPTTPEELLVKAESLADAIAANGPLAIRVALDLLEGTDPGLAAGLAHESDAAALVTTGEEANERIAAFVNKLAARAARPPQAAP